MDLVNTLDHRISVTIGKGKDKEHVVRRPGPFSVDGEAADKFRKLPGVYPADSDEGQAWLEAHGTAELSQEGSQLDRRARAAAFGAGARAEMAKQNRTLIGDDAAPAGPASGVVTAGGDRPIDPSLTTTETEADALRHGIDLSDEPPVGYVGPTGETLADITPGSAPGSSEQAMADAAVPGDGGLADTPIPTRSGVQRPSESAEGEPEPGELKGEALEEAVRAHNERADEEDDVERIPSDAKAEEKRAALAAQSEKDAA
jgi:hypothetical protein